MHLGVLVGLPLAALGTWLPSAAPTLSAGAAAAVANQASVAIGSGDFYYTAPDVIEGGLVTIEYSNAGPEPHHAQIVRLPDSVSLEQFSAALAGDEKAVFGLVQQVGGAAAVAPGRTTEVALTLDAGTYALICVIPTPSDGIRHFAKGMVKPFLVTPAMAPVEPPAIVGTISLRDFTFDMPDTIAAGRSVYAVTNEGPAQPHEVAFVKLAPGKTAEDARQAIMNPGGRPPFEPVGGFQSTDVAGGGYVTMDLEPGEYAAICRVTEPISGVSHVHLGMVKGFSVV